MSANVSHWTGLIPNPKINIGFIYMITCLTTGKKYIGRKTFWKMIPKSKRSLRNPIRDKGLTNGVKTVGQNLIGRSTQGHLKILMNIYYRKGKITLCFVL